LYWATPTFARAVTADGLRALSSIGFQPTNKLAAKRRLIPLLPFRGVDVARSEHPHAPTSTYTNGWFLRKARRSVETSQETEAADDPPTW